MRLNITISDEMNDTLNIICQRWACSKSDLISIILGQYLESFDKKAFYAEYVRIQELKYDEALNEKIKRLEQLAKQ